MALLNGVKKGFNINKLVIIGSGDIVKDIMDDFIKRLKLKKEIRIIMQNYFEKKFNKHVNDNSASIAAKDVHIPTLVIHDENDNDVPIHAAFNIQKHLSNAQLITTKGLGHRKILGNGTVIDNIIKFL